MARGRMLNKKVSRSLQFDQLPDDTCRLLATWTIAHLDVNGVFCADPGVVRSLIFTRRTDISIEQVEVYLQAMEDVGLIVRYECAGDTWQYWPEFRQNQPGLRADRETPEYPMPPDEMLEEDRRDDGGNPATIRQDDDEMPAEEKLSEVKLSELPDAIAPVLAPSLVPALADNSNYTSGQKKFLELFGAKRFKLKVQAKTVADLETQYGLPKLLELATWAGKRGMSLGDAVVSVETALKKQAGDTKPKIIKVGK